MNHAAPLVRQTVDGTSDLLRQTAMALSRPSEPHLPSPRGSLDQHHLSQRRWTRNKPGQQSSRKRGLSWLEEHVRLRLSLPTCHFLRVATGIYYYYY